MVEQYTTPYLQFIYMSIDNTSHGKLFIIKSTYHNYNTPGTTIVWIDL